MVSFAWAGAVSGSAHLCILSAQQCLANNTDPINIYGQMNLGGGVCSGDRTEGVPAPSSYILRQVITDAGQLEGLTDNSQTEGTISPKSSPKREHPERQKKRDVSCPAIFKTKAQRKKQILG